MMCSPSLSFEEVVDFGLFQLFLRSFPFLSSLSFLSLEDEDEDDEEDEVELWRHSRMISPESS